jgi:hypothetical protein
MSYKREAIPVRNIFIDRSMPAQPLRESEKDYFRRAANMGAVVDDLVVTPHPDLPGKFLLIHGRKIFAGLRYVSELKGNEEIKAVCKVFDFGGNQAKMALQYLTMNRGRDVDPMIELELIMRAMQSFTPEEIHVYSNVPYRHIENLLRLNRLNPEYLYYIRTGVLHVMHALTLINRFDTLEEVEGILRVAKQTAQESGAERITAVIIQQAMEALSVTAA